MIDNFERAVREALGYAYATGYDDATADREAIYYPTVHAPRIVAELRAALERDVAAGALAAHGFTLPDHDEPATAKEPTP